VFITNFFNLTVVSFLVHAWAALIHDKEHVLLIVCVSALGSKKCFLFSMGVLLVKQNYGISAMIFVTPNERMFRLHALPRCRRSCRISTATYIRFRAIPSSLVIWSRNGFQDDYE